MSKRKTGLSFAYQLFPPLAKDTAHSDDEWSSTDGESDYVDQEFTSAEDAMLISDDTANVATKPKRGRPKKIQTSSTLPVSTSKKKASTDVNDSDVVMADGQGNPGNPETDIRIIVQLPRNNVRPTKWRSSPVLQINLPEQSLFKDRIRIKLASHIKVDPNDIDWARSEWKIAPERYFRPAADDETDWIDTMYKKLTSLDDKKVDWRVLTVRLVLNSTSSDDQEVPATTQGKSKSGKKSKPSKQQKTAINAVTARLFPLLSTGIPVILPADMQAGFYAEVMEMQTKMLSDPLAADGSNNMVELDDEHIRDVSDPASLSHHDLPFNRTSPVVQNRPSQSPARSPLKNLNVDPSYQGSPSKNYFDASEMMTDDVSMEEDLDLTAVDALFSI